MPSPPDPFPGLNRPAPRPGSPSARVRALLWAAALGLLLQAGCTTSSRADQKFLATHQAFKPVNRFPGQAPSEPVLRLAVLPLFHANPPTAPLVELDAVFLDTLGQWNLAELVPVSPEQVAALAGHPRVSPRQPLPEDFFSRLRADTGADAVLFTDLTAYRTLKPVAAGLRLRLVDLRDLQTLAAFDQIFDSGNPSVEIAARRFHQEHQHQAYPLDTSSSVLNSPRRFFAYAAWEAAAALATP